MVLPPPPEGRRQVLVTGGLGFVGSYLTECLLCRGDGVTVLDNLLTGRREHLATWDGHPGLRVVIGDAADVALVDRLVASSDVVYHLAAALGVRLVVERPLLCLETNVLATHAVLRAAADHGVPALVASTSEVYGKRADPPFAEDDDVVLGPTSRSRWGYAASKMVDELLALAYHEERGLPVVVFRLFNTVGPRQTGRYGMVIPRFVAASLRGEAMQVYGDGLQTRCFLHVLDAVDAIERLAHTPEACGQVVNIGSDEEVSILELAMRVRAHVARRDLLPEGHGAKIDFVPYEQAYGPGFEDMRVRRPDTARLRALTGWRPTRTLDDVLDDVITERAARPAGDRDVTAVLAAG